MIVMDDDEEKTGEGEKENWGFFLVGGRKIFYLERGQGRERGKK
jgi:hypothetical protein